MTIFQRVILVSAGLIFATIAIFGAMSFQSGRSLLERSIQDRLEAVATNQRDKIQSLTEAWRDRSALIASRTQLRISLKKYLDTNDDAALARVNHILGDALTSVRSVRALAITPPDGPDIISLGNIGTTETKVIFGRQPDRKIRLLDMLSTAAGQLFIRLQAPLMLNNKTIGQLIVTLSADELTQATNDYIGLGKTGEVLLAALGADGQTTYLTPHRFDNGSASANYPPIEQALQKKDSLARNATDYRGQETMAYSRYIPDTGWGVVVKMDTAEILNPVNQFGRGILAVGAFLVFMALGTGFLLARGISKPLERLANDANRIQTGEHLLRSKIDKSDAREIRSLAESFNGLADSLLQSNAELEQRVTKRTRELRDLNETLEQRVELRTRELNITNETLSAAMDELRQAQNELVHSEKMAALGGLVAGVAHELNTPIGIGVTGISHLQEELGKIKERYASNQITRGDLQVFIKTVEQACNLLVTHLNRAAELVNDFKLVAVDQSNPDIRSIELADYLDKVVATLQPKFKRLPHNVVVNVPANLSITTCPGALAQALTALVSNCLKHAFAPDTDTAGTVTVSAEATDKGCRLIISDNGKGIPEKAQSRIFEPFYTTARGEGGCGLGLSIVHSIVTDVLKGDIRCESTVGQGTKMRIRLPNLQEGEMPSPIHLVAS